MQREAASSGLVKAERRRLFRAIRIALLLSALLPIAAGLIYAESTYRQRVGEATEQLGRAVALASEHSLRVFEGADFDPLRDIPDADRTAGRGRTLDPADGSDPGIAPAYAHSGRHRCRRRDQGLGTLAQFDERVLARLISGCNATAAATAAFTSAPRSSVRRTPSSAYRSAARSGTRTAPSPESPFWRSIAVISDGSSRAYPAPPRKPWAFCPRLESCSRSMPAQHSAPTIPISSRHGSGRPNTRQPGKAMSRSRMPMGDRTSWRSRPSAIMGSMPSQA
ncbi:hypothetical protein BTHI11S_03602 [Bosea thiooxidans]